MERRLFERFGPRCPPERRAELGAVIARAVRDAGSEDVAAALVAGGCAWLAPGAAWLDDVPRDRRGDAIALTGPEALLRELDDLGAVVPPELGDGPTPRWAPVQRARDEVIGWWQRWLARRRSARLQVYAHVPFCRTRCGFCQFSSVIARGDDEVDSFVRALEDEADALAAALGRLRADAITIGGGTPSHLETPLLARVLAAVARVCRLDRGGYYSVELNPDSTTEEKLRLLAASGVTRVSFGVQSFHGPTLRAVSRGYQTQEMVGAAFAAARRVGGLRISLDLIASLPDEDAATFAAGVAHALGLEPDELVLYDYQPVERRGSTVPAGALAWSTARQVFLDAARQHGYALEPAGAAAVVVSRTPAPWSFRYLQHPREVCATLGLGPFAESYLPAVAQYVGELEGARIVHRGEDVDAETERGAQIGRAIGAGLDFDPGAVAAATGAAPDAVEPALAWLQARGIVTREGTRVRVASSGRQELRRATWLFQDERTREHLRDRAAWRGAKLAAGAPAAVPLELRPAGRQALRALAGDASHAPIAALATLVLAGTLADPRAWYVRGALHALSSRFVVPPASAVRWLIEACGADPSRVPDWDRVEEIVAGETLRALWRLDRRRSPLWQAATIALPPELAASETALLELDLGSRAGERVLVLCDLPERAARGVQALGIEVEGRVRSLHVPLEGSRLRLDRAWAVTSASRHRSLMQRVSP